MDLVTAEVIATVAQVNKVGSGFFSRYDGRLFLVTAEHVVGPETTVELNLRWNPAAAPIECELWATRCRPEEHVGDLAVFTLPPELDVRPDLTLPTLESNGITWSQEVFALGYPGVLLDPIGHRSHHGLPLIRKGILAGMDFGPKTGPWTNDLILDMSAAPGNSGGPVVFKKEGKWAIAGVLRSEFTLPLEQMPSRPSEARQASGYTRVVPIEKAVHLMQVPAEPAKVVSPVRLVPVPGAFD